MNTIYDMPCGDIILEELNTMMLAQDPKDRMHYVDAVLESVLSPAGKSKLIQQLYVDIIQKSNIDFGKIPQSKGNLTGYEYYDPMVKSIDALNTLFNDGSNKKVEELDLTNRLHDLIVECRDDFEYGYKFDVQIVQITYCLLVMSLYDMIGLCINKYTNYMKDIKGVEFKFTQAKTNKNLLLKYVRDFIKGYDSGEWTKMMISFKKHPTEVKSMALNNGKATEGFADVVKAGISAGVGYVGAAAGLAGAIGTVWGVIWVSLTIFFAIRGLIYLAYYVPFKINAYIKVQADFLKYAIEKDNEPSSTSVESQKKFLSKLESLSTFIETRILRMNTVAKKKLDEDAKTNYSKADLLSAGGDVSII